MDTQAPTTPNERLRSAIDLLGFTLKEYSRASGIPYQSLHKYTRLADHLPDGTGMSRIAATGIDLNYLVTGQGGPINGAFCRAYVVREFERIASRATEPDHIYVWETREEASRGFFDAWNSQEPFPPKDEAPRAVQVAYPTLPLEFYDWIGMPKPTPTSYEWRSLDWAGLDAWLRVAAELGANGVTPDEALAAVKATRGVR